MKFLKDHKEVLYLAGYVLALIIGWHYIYLDAAAKHSHEPHAAITAYELLTV